MPNGGGVVLATTGYRFTESFGAEFAYLGQFSSQFDTRQISSNYMGFLKYFYRVNRLLTLSTGIGAGINHTNITQAQNSNAPKDYLDTKNTNTGFVALPVGFEIPIEGVDNLSFSTNYIYALTFNNTSVNFVTSGLTYSFL